MISLYKGGKTTALCSSFLQRNQDFFRNDSEAECALSVRFLYTSTPFGASGPLWSRNEVDLLLPSCTWFGSTNPFVGSIIMLNDK